MSDIATSNDLLIIHHNKNSLINYSAPLINYRNLHLRDVMWKCFRMSFVVPPDFLVKSQYGEDASEV